MFIRLTLSSTKQHIFLRADMILTVERNLKNPLEVVVTYSGTATVQGPGCYPVLESQEDIVRGVIAAMKSGELVKLEETAGTSNGPSRLIGSN